MNNLIVNPIGKIITVEGQKAIKLDEKYIPALEGLEEFGHIQIIWWFDGCDNTTSRNILTNQKPYKNGPDTLGTFATRSPARPNPIALTASYVTHIDKENGMIFLAFIDADDESPVLDIKPYTPSLDKIRDIIVPDWCAGWPSCSEESGDFDWSTVFNF